MSSLTAIISWFKDGSSKQENPTTFCLALNDDDSLIITCVQVEIKVI